MVNVDWKRALSRLVSGVYVLTVEDETGPNAMPVSWVAQVSARPPLVAAAVSPIRRSHDLIVRAGAFGLNLISPEQAPLVERFKLPGPGQFEGVALEVGEAAGAPLLAEAPVSLECRVHTAYSPGDHTLFIGEVVSVRVRGEGEVLSAAAYGHSYTGER